MLVAVDLRGLELERDGQQVLLGPVVEVALDPLPLVEVRGREPGAGLGDLLDLAGQLGPQPQVVDLRRR